MVGLCTVQPLWQLTHSLQGYGRAMHSAATVAAHTLPTQFDHSTRCSTMHLLFTVLDRPGVDRRLRQTNTDSDLVKSSTFTRPMLPVPPQGGGQAGGDRHRTTFHGGGVISTLPGMMVSNHEAHPPPPLPKRR